MVLIVDEWKSSSAGIQVLRCRKIVVFLQGCALSSFDLLGARPSKDVAMPCVDR